MATTWGVPPIFTMGSTVFTRLFPAKLSLKHTEQPQLQAIFNRIWSVPRNATLRQTQNMNGGIIQQKQRANSFGAPDS